MTGIGTGITYSITPLYFGEVSPPKVRGILSTVLTVSCRIGMLFIYSIGPFLSVKDMATLSLILPFSFVVTCLWISESPYYLIRKGRRKEAEESLMRIRRKKNVDEELNIIEQSVQDDLQGGTRFRDLFMVLGNRR